MKNKKGAGLLGMLTLISGAFIFAYYGIYLALCLIGFEKGKMVPYVLLPLCVICIPFIFRKHLPRLLGRAYRALHALFTSLLCIYVVSVIIFWAFIGFYPKGTPEYYAEQYALENNSGSDTVILVFGCLTNGMTPSQSLKNRLDAAYELLCALPDSLCVVSGAQGASETVAECVAMRGYLIGLGISEERIIMEENARSTSENIRFSKDLLDKLGMSDKRIIGVSTSFHLPRIEIMSERYDFQVDTCTSPSPSIFNYYVSMVREYLSYIKMVLFDKAVFIHRVG